MLVYVKLLLIQFVPLYYKIYPFKGVFINKGKVVYAIYVVVKKSKLTLVVFILAPVELFITVTIGY